MQDSVNGKEAINWDSLQTIRPKFRLLSFFLSKCVVVEL